MRIVFLGTTTFSKNCLESVINFKKINLVGIISSKKNFSISYSKKKIKNFRYSDLSSIGKKNNIPFFIVDKGMKSISLLKKVKKLKPDMFLVVGWYYNLSKEWLKIAPAFGLHSSLLPDYKGGAPLVWAMINQEKRTGITLFKLKKKIDSGLIINQTSEKIYLNDTIKTLSKRIEKIGISLLKKSLPNILNSNKNNFKIKGIKSRTFPQRRPDDGLINWKSPVVKIDSVVRAQTKPYPGAFTYFCNQKLKIWSGIVKKKINIKHKYGLLEKIRDKYFVTCKNGYYQIIEISYKNKIYKNKQFYKIFDNKKRIKFTNKKNDSM